VECCLLCRLRWSVRWARWDCDDSGDGRDEGLRGTKVTFVDTSPAFSNPFDLADVLHPTYGALSKAAGGALTVQPLVRPEAE
jgi:hypothetical protein